MVKKLIHVEGLVVLFVAMYMYYINDFSWWLFILLLLAPDLSALAYLLNVRLGAQVYNLFHTYAVSVLVTLIGVAVELDLMYMIGLIWTAHIGMDRLLGYGLKYSSSFKETHMQKI
ncbi:DUF4260 domain-containing protein [Priestia taiwanensis]|uniref:DUF4260 domain-containing protein n=1 Tax=Priestia taiwanensis TaxID=1347902 RepID=A0A917EPX9_9BACI|nr:DUF4260 domain-containing protein [Priestia taiwanensis]MBM7362634.1 hypothetical protein [Priestia taiwanensis]GGE63843.1 hypothetical protein GCM10007140_12590 [Priestia taiwanensis]